MKNSEPAYIIHYYFKKLIRYSKQIKNGYSEERIHLFRVDVKKLRAFLRMMRIGSEKPDQLKFPRKFKKMYSLTGKIRDRQLCLKRILESNSSNNKIIQSQITFLKEEIKSAETNIEFLGNKEFSEIEEKMIKALPAKSTNNLVKNFFLKKLVAIHEIISKKKYTDKELHDIRKNIKDIIYIIRIFRDDIRSTLPLLFWNKSELKIAEDLSHTLGLFNDVCIALSFLKSDDIKKVDSTGAKHLSSMRRKLLAEKRGLREKILSITPELNLHIS